MCAFISRNYNKQCEYILKLMPHVTDDSMKKKIKVTVTVIGQFCTFLNKHPTEGGSKIHLRALLCRPSKWSFFK